MAKNSRKPDLRNLYFEIENLEERLVLDASLTIPIDTAPVDCAAIECESRLIETDSSLPADEVSAPEISETGIFDEEMLNTVTVETQLDDLGRVIFESTHFDEDGDGVTDWSYSARFTYNAQGQVISQIYEDDYDGDGQADSISTSTNVYDENGNLISNEFVSDFDGDGNADSTSTSTNVYDENGNLISNEFVSDYDGDGNADSTSTSTSVYDENGNQISNVFVSDYDGDGNADFTSSSSSVYDENGNMISNVSLTDYDGDGTTDITSTTTSVYDENGNMISNVLMSDYNGDGVFDDISRTTTDADGVVTYEQEIDEDGDGDIDFRMVSSYDAGGNEISFQTWSDSDGDGDFTETTNSAAENEGIPTELYPSDPLVDVVIDDSTVLNRGGISETVVDDPVAIEILMKTTDVTTDLSLELSLAASSGEVPELNSAAVETANSSIEGIYFAPAGSISVGLPAAPSASSSVSGAMLVFESDSNAAPSSADPVLTVNNSNESAGFVVQPVKRTTDGETSNSTRLDSRVETSVAEDLSKNAGIVASRLR